MHLRTHSRREFLLKGTCAAAALLSRPVTAQTPLTLDSRTLEEVQQSDVDATPEIIRYSGIKEFTKASPTDLGRYPKRKPEAIARAMLQKAGDYADRNVNRKDNQPEITQFLNLLDYPFEEKGKPTAFCAAGVSFVACQAFCETNPLIPYNRTQPVSELRRFLPIIDAYYFLPSVTVGEIKENADHRGIWVQNSHSVSPKRGWLVIFAFRQDQLPSHIGIVDCLGDFGLKTVEFNTGSTSAGSQGNGGFVARKTRLVGPHILGYVGLY
jgi:hypothetical protein